MMMMRFGIVLKSWCDKKGNPHKDVKEIWPLLQELCSNRNNIHLYRAIENKTDYNKILLAEEKALDDALKILSHLQKLIS